MITMGFRFIAFAVALLFLLLLIEPSAAATGILLVLAVVAFAVIPWVARRFLRRQMIDLRGGIERDIEADKLPDAPAVWSIHALTTSTNRELRDLTFLHLLAHAVLSYRTGRHRRYAEIESGWTEAAAQLRRGRRKRLRSYEVSWKNGVALHVFLGTPSGWVGAVFGAFALGTIVIMRLITRPSLRLGKQVIADRLRRTRDRLGRHVRYEIQPAAIAERPKRVSARTG